MAEMIMRMDETLFAALADPIRRSLLEHLAEHGPKTATQLATLYPITRQAILKHLTILEAAGLVTVQQHGREKRYLFIPAPLDDLEQWRAAIHAKWDARLMRLKALLEQE